MVKLGVSGARGRMGQRIIALAKEDKDLTLAFGLEDRSNPEVGKVIDEVKIIGDPEQINSCDCLIEFTSPEASLEHLAFAVKFNKPLVIGTTGLSQEEQSKIEEASKIIPIVFAPNMSVGVNLLFRLLKEAAGILKGYQVNVEEAHHIHKKDAPSGTAKKIAEVINSQGFSIKSEEIKSIREGEVVGDHRVVFESPVDKIELSHFAKTRDIFAQGSLVAAKWLVDKKPGLYSMEDVLFERSL